MNEDTFDIEQFVKNKKAELVRENKLDKLEKIPLEDQIYIIRGFNRREWVEFVSECAKKNIMPDSIEFENETINTMVVYPENLNVDAMSAGTTTTLFNYIMELSGFSNEEIKPVLL